MFSKLMAVMVAALALAGCATSPGGGKQGKWTTLFDGKGAPAFRGYNQTNFPSKAWIIEEGALKTVPGAAIDLVTLEEYDDFELEFEWKVPPGGNSGVFYNASETSGPIWYTGPEYQVLDDARHPDGRNPLTSAGALYGLRVPEGKTLNPVGEYNTSRIVSKGDHVEHWLNGKKVVDYTWGSPEIAALIQKSKFKDLPGFMKKDSGLIGFQHHGEIVWFRNIRIRRI